MRKLLVAGVLAVLLVGCETKTPVEPSVTPTTAPTSTTVPPTPGQTTTVSTTTTAVLGSLARSYKAFPPPPANVPSEMTLFFELLTGPAATAPAAGARPILEAAGLTENVYKVTGVFVMGNGTTGTVDGELGGASNPLETGGESGQMTIRSAILLGAEQVIAIDYLPERLSMAAAAGAITINFEEESVIERLNELTGGEGPHKCIDAVGTESHVAMGQPDTVLDRAKQMLKIENDRPHVLREMIYVCRPAGVILQPNPVSSLSHRIRSRAPGSWPSTTLLVSFTVGIDQSAFVLSGIRSRIGSSRQRYRATTIITLSIGSRRNRGT